jgi:hypothetical protein
MMSCPGCPLALALHRIKVKYLGPVPFARRWACHRDMRNTQSYTKYAEFHPICKSRPNMHVYSEYANLYIIRNISVNTQFFIIYAIYAQYAAYAGYAGISYLKNLKYA